MCSRHLISLTLSHSHLSLNPFPFPISLPLLFCFLLVQGPVPRSAVSVVRRGRGCEQNTLSSPLHTGLGDETNTTTDRWSSSESFHHVCVCVCVWERNRSFLSGQKRNLIKATVLHCEALLNKMLLVLLLAGCICTFIYIFYNLSIQTATQMTVWTFRLYCGAAFR